MCESSLPKRSLLFSLVFLSALASVGANTSAAEVAAPSAAPSLAVVAPTPMPIALVNEDEFAWTLSRFGDSEVPGTIQTAGQIPRSCEISAGGCFCVVDPENDGCGGINSSCLPEWDNCKY